MLHVIQDHSRSSLSGASSFTAPQTRGFLPGRHANGSVRHCPVVVAIFIGAPIQFTLPNPRLRHAGPCLQSRKKSLISPQRRISSQRRRYSFPFLERPCFSTSAVWNSTPHFLDFRLQDPRPKPLITILSKSQSTFISTQFYCFDSGTVFR